MHRSVPELKDANAVIERNKIIRKNGVPYEIDLWVRLNPDTLYETTHILECKLAIWAVTLTLVTPRKIPGWGPQSAHHKSSIGKPPAGSLLSLPSD